MMKFLSSNFKTVFLVLFLMHSIFNMMPRDYDILVAAQVHGIQTLLLSVNIFAFFADVKTTKSIIYKSVLIACVVIEIFAGIFAFINYKGVPFDEIPTSMKLFIGMPSSLAVMLSFFVTGSVNTKNKEQSLEQVTEIRS